MILVLTGTNPYCFKRLISAMDSWASDSSKDIIIQLGNTQYEPLNCKYSRFFTRDKLLDYINKAEFIVSQGGFGSLRDCLKVNKKIIAVPRYKELGECLDDQVQIVKALEDKDMVIGIYDISNLHKALSKINGWQNKTPVESNFAVTLNKYLSQL